MIYNAFSSSYLPHDLPTASKIYLTLDTLSHLFTVSVERRLLSVYQLHVMTFAMSFSFYG